ncbi:MAG: hypothetical protein CFE24_05785 [Flavobacterium sp. BFFFF2]|nr:MAG: hypothetical protein CFE24_05785 [Flavobacterium sp. BFFFF2]
MKTMTHNRSLFSDSIGSIGSDSLKINCFGNRSWSYEQIDALYIQTRWKPLLKTTGTCWIIAAISAKIWFTANITLAPFLIDTWLLIFGFVIPFIRFLIPPKRILVLQCNEVKCRWKIPAHIYQDYRQFRIIAQQVIAQHRNVRDLGVAPPNTHSISIN